MAFVYRPITVKPIPKNATIRTVDGRSCAVWINRKHKKVVAELTPDGSRCRVESPCWWVEYTTADKKRDRVKGFPSREATNHLATDLERAANDVRAGHEAPQREGPDYLTDHLADFEAALGRKGGSAKHVAHTVKQVRTVVAELRLTMPGAVDRERVEEWLDDEQKRLKWGARTRNQWAGSLNQFGRWLVRAKKARLNPFDGLARQNIEADRRRVRRVLDPADLDRLILAARDSAATVRGLTGPERAWLYLLAAYTGRRLGALKQMSATDVAWEDGRPVAITTSARLQKSRKAHTVPVHPELADDLAAWLATRPPTGPLFAGWKRWADRGADILRHDLAAARAAWIAEAKGGPVERARREASDRLKYTDHAGEVFDFHALRGQFITSLAVNGVELTAAQELADHSDPKLTANVYTKWKNKLAGQIAKLPAPGVRLGVTASVGYSPGYGLLCATYRNREPSTGRAQKKRRGKPRGSRVL